MSKIKEILKNTSLKNRLKVNNEMAFIQLLTVLGYREDKMWSESENGLLSKLCKFADEQTEHQLSLIRKWQDDGSPVR